MQITFYGAEKMPRAEMRIFDEKNGFGMRFPRKKVIKNYG
jgi:hypothetical protein